MVFINLIKVFGKTVIKSRKGSTLVMSIIIIIIMSLMGISLIALTLSSVDMSMMFGDVNKAYFAAEAAAEEVAKNLDQKVSDIQEEARAQTTIEIQTMLRENPIYFREYDGSISISDSEPEFNVSKIEDEFKSLYLENFYTLLNDEFNDIDNLDKMKELLDTADDNGNFPYKDLNENQGRMLLKSASYDHSNHNIEIIVSGIHNDYEKKLNAVFSLLPHSEKIPYQTVEKFAVKNPVKYDVLKKAVVAEKNMIISSCDVVITGDVLCFGTIPVIDNLLPPEDIEEDYDAQWNMYGGIIVGMCQNVSSKWAHFGFNPSKIGEYSNGSLKVNGNASTMGYIHSVYNTIHGSQVITISGNAYARSVRSEKYSNNSIVNFNNLSVIDNLQIDSNNTVFNVNGVFKGFVDTWHAIDGSDGEDPDINSKPKMTSSVVVNGDSTLNFNDAVYIGGSTYLKNRLNSEGNPYMTGVSALKSSWRIANMYSRDGLPDPDNNELSWNKIYWYDNETRESTQTNAQYRNHSGVDMISGRESAPDYFPLLNRAMHIKTVWDEILKDDYILSTYISPNNINMYAIASEQKLKGFSNGAVIANGRVYSPFDFETFDPSEFHNTIQKPAISDYYDQIKGLIKEDFNPVSPKLNYVAPTKSIISYMDNDFVGINRIEKNRIYTPADSNRGFVYYGDQDADIREIAGKWFINSEIIPVDNKGIIFVEGNIYIHSDFKFTGVIMSSKNIIFLGDAEITYDESAIDTLLKADVNINGFFGLLSSKVPLGTMESQRITTRNISVIKWNEIK